MQKTLATMVGTMNLTEVTDHYRIGPLQVRVFALCLASLIDLRLRRPSDGLRLDDDAARAQHRR